MKRKIFSALATVLLVLICLPAAASAELLDKDADPVEIVRSGSFESTDKTKMDFSVEGGTLTGARWTVVRHGAIYSLEGTFKEGEDISLSITGTQSPLPDEKSRVFNYMKVTITFFDKGYKPIGEVQTYWSDYVKDGTLSCAMGSAVPPGTIQASINASFNCRWASPYVVIDESVALFVTLKPEKTPTSALPAATESKPESKPEPETQPQRQPETQPENTRPSSSFIPEQASIPEPRDEKPHDGGSPWEHTGPMETVAISVIAAIAAVLGGAGGSAAAAAAGTIGGTTGIEGGTSDDDPDPAYERARVPDYPEFVVGRDGERITKRPDGTIEASFPNGNAAIYFPNGMVQMKSPDGATREEWPDGTVSASDDGHFVVEEPDGTMTVREPNGDETVFKPDGTSVETKSDGMKITKDAQGETVSVEFDGYVVTRHPEDPDAKIITSPYGGSLVVREKPRTETFRNADGKWEHKTEYETVLEGEMRTEDATHVYGPDGTRESRGDDGSVYVQHADGSVNASSPDGTDLKYNAKTGEVDYKFSDGSYVKGNEQTGELDAKMADGSYWQRDAKGNGSFDDKKKGTKGVCREDGSFKTESKDGSLTQQADGTIEAKTNDGTTLIEKADGTVTLVDKDGASLTRNADGTGFMRKPDGTISPLPPLPL